MGLNEVFLPVSITDVDTLCQHYLTILYSAEQTARVSRPLDNITETYGEILYPSVDKLLSMLALTAQDVFVDLGSGKGQVVIQVFIKSSVHEAWGIEIVPTLHHLAVAAGKHLQSTLPELFHDSRKINFFSGSFLDIDFLTATVVFINSACFTQSLLNDLGERLENTPSIHTVLSLRPIRALSRLVFKRVIRIECSWDSALCYVYTT